MRAIFAWIDAHPADFGVYVLLFWNLITFSVTAIDKFRAKHGMWRTRERTLVLFSVFLGGVGTLLAFYLFRHKTKHYRLLFWIWFFTVLELCGTVAAVIFLH